MATLRELLDKVENIKPIASRNGVKIVSFEEQRDLAQAEKLQNPGGLNVLEFNEDGSLSSTPTRYAAVNIDTFYRNRFKKVDDEVWIVTDYRAIKEQASGRVYAKRIPAFVIKRGANKKLVLSRMVTISDDEFISDFTHILNRETMEEILPLLENGVEVTKEGLGI